jgi:hypothetical protein
MRNSPQKVGVSFLHDFPVSTLALRWRRGSCFLLPACCLLLAPAVVLKYLVVRAFHVKRNVNSKLVSCFVSTFECHAKQPPKSRCFVSPRFSRLPRGEDHDFPVSTLAISKPGCAAVRLTEVKVSTVLGHSQVIPLK